MPGNSAGSVLNDGHPEALDWLINHVDGMIKSQGLDWYREDMNRGHHGAAWRKNDAGDRQGITENLYQVEHDQRGNILSCNAQCCLAIFGL